VEELMRIVELQKDFGSYEFLPMLALINKQSQIANQLSVESEMTIDERAKLRMQRHQIRLQMSLLQTTDVVKSYSKVI